MTKINQTDNHGAGFVVKMARLHREPLRPQVDAHGEQPGGAGAERHQSIHGGSAVHQAFPRAAIKVAACENHYRQGDEANPQPQRAVVVGDHHIVAEHAPDHHRDTHRQGEGGLPAKALHCRLSGLLLTFPAFIVIFNGFSAVSGFLHRAD